ncbi:FadR family transcriptional regulator [Streptomyces sp. 4503]|uniref:FadR family transcriptional regulator n=1 Tax=Streptomyces niphimycinicus TaxID=2842201 RepID=A0ABS6C6S9_9ACTN|nr:FadR/GntR family transcriptional regulator [Streptomyces niphimycinicus]MBU3862602.1 FadR family transcriptional regulator [Streptomyces niphimycinicus]
MTSDTPANFGAPPPYVSQEQVLIQLEQRILSGALKVGDRLPSERTLCAEYKVSRPVIREALRGLQERGYIEIYPGRGSFVRGVVASDLARPLTRLAQRTGVTPRHLVTARTMLECQAAGMAAQYGSDEQIEEIRAALERHQAARTLQQLARTDLAFHEAVARASGNPVIVVMFGAIRPLVYGLMLRSLSDSEVLRAADPWHVTIYERIARRDAEAARSGMSEHLRLALDLYGEDLDVPLEDVLAGRGIDVARLEEELTGGR